MSGKNYAVIGKSVARVDARAKVTGEALYPGDINLPNQAYMKILFADRPHAIIRSIDTAAAEMLPGVLAVFTARDVPVNEYGLIMSDQPVLCGPGSSKPFADRVRFVGDQVALVVADSEEIAAQARDLIQVEYEDLPVVTDVLQAMGAGDADKGRGTWHVPPDQHVPLGARRAPLLHPDKGSNIFGHYRIRKGDVEAAFAGCAVVVEGEYRTPAQEHAFLQPEAGIAYLDEAGRVTVQVAGQWTHEDQEQIAHALDLPLEQVRVIYPAIGGAFGGREDMSVQIVLALAAWRLQQRGIPRPVKIIWTREESIIGHHKRHPYILRTRWGARRDGKLTAAEVELIADGGAYAYTTTKVMGNATLMCTGPYEIPNVKVDSYAVYTNNLPNGAFRGFGGPQGAFAAETQMNRLAEALGMDPVEIRRRNLLNEDSLLSVGTKLPKGVSIRQVVDACADRMKQSAESAMPSPEATLLRGTGFACAYKNVGFSFGAPEYCIARVELHGKGEIERAVLYHAGAEVGQGLRTIVRQVAAEALKLPEQETISLKDFKAEIMIIEMLNVHCHTCQLQMPVFNGLAEAIQSDAFLTSRVAMLGITVGNNAASLVGKFIWFGPFKPLQKLFFHTPLVYIFVFGSFFYHDFIYWPLKAKPQMQAFKKTSKWGKLFDDYPED